MVRGVGTVRGEVEHFRGHAVLVVDVTHRNDAWEAALSGGEKMRVEHSLSFLRIQC